jgi:hypothetical protein
MNSPNDPNSITDWFKRHGMDGSYQSRENFFRGIGWSDYRGTAQQNTNALNTLKYMFGD